MHTLDDAVSSGRHMHSIIPWDEDRLLLIRRHNPRAAWRWARFLETLSTWVPLLGETRHSLAVRSRVAPVTLIYEFPRMENGHTFLAFTRMEHVSPTLFASNRREFGVTGVIKARRP